MVDYNKKKVNQGSVLVNLRTKNAAFGYLSIWSLWLVNYVYYKRLKGT